MQVVRSALLRSPRRSPEPAALPLRVVGEAGRAAAELAALLEAAHERGRAAGREEARVAAETAVARAVSVWEAAAGSLAALREQLVAEAEITARGLALEIAAHVLRGEVAAGRPLARALAREAASRLREPGRLLLRVHPDDVALLRESAAAPAGAAPQSARAATLEVAADASIERGGCLVEGGGMLVDARLRSQLAVIAEELGVTAAADDDELTAAADDDELTAAADDDEDEETAAAA